MARLVINGRRTVSGVHRVQGNKNAALLSPEPVTLENVPEIEDVAMMLEAARSFGAKISRDLAAGTATISAPRIRTARIAPELAAKIRTSFLFAGPLLARLGRASLPPPGGDPIGHRRLDTHFAGFRALGAKVSGAGTNLIKVEGVDSLHGAAARVGCDYIEAGSYVAAAAATGGELTLENVDPEPFEALEGAFARFGVTWSVDAKARTLHYVPRKRLKMKYDLGDAIPSVADGTWPAFPSDLISVLIVLATQARGTCLFFEKMFESRLYFVDRLRQMGAKIVQCDPHRVVVTGPSTLYGGAVSSNDIRAGISLVIAALCAKGETVIENAETIDRGYAAIERGLSALGADIRRA